MDQVEITVTVSKGLICDVDIPKSLDNVIVVVKDYDTDGSEDNIRKDEDGEYTIGVWQT